ncbi:MAG: PEP-CTERM sorting domain-containing protein [Armatimonadetes bacterium]|nr:PEP-CTERM sorting domain-containing protein [Armatimonadota bacterium]
MKTMFCLVLIAVLAVGAGSAWAFDIPLVNASFENGIAGWTDYWGSMYSWDVGANAYDGVRIGQPGGNLRFQQAVSAVIQANTVYTASMWISKYPDQITGGSLWLWATPTPGVLDVPDTNTAGAVSFAVNIPTLTNPMQDWSWMQISTSFSSAAHPELVGYGLAVAVHAVNGTTTNYDLVQLTGTVIPEPSAMLALGSGLFGLIGFAIKRKR